MPFNLGNHTSRSIPTAGLIAELGPADYRLFGGSAHRSSQQGSYLLMEDLVGRHPDGIQEAVSLQVFINLWLGEGRIATKVVPILFVLVSLDDQVQNFLPTISAVNITRAQQDAFTIPELIEAEQSGWKQVLPK